MSSLINSTYASLVKEKRSAEGLKKHFETILLPQAEKALAGADTPEKFADLQNKVDSLKEQIQRCDTIIRLTGEELERRQKLLYDLKTLQEKDDDVSD